MKSILFLFFIIISFNSCTNEAEIVNNNSFEINSISSQNSFIFDTVTIYGTGFNYEDIELISETDDINYKVITHSNTELTFVPLSPLENSEISLLIDGRQSNAISFSVNLTPLYDTTVIGSGEFVMGNITGFADESPTHKVNITNNLITLKHEVTNLLWHQVMDTIVVDTEIRDFPKDSISWYQAILFSNRLSTVYGLEPAYIINNNQVEFDYNSNGWRLPTEAEWEFICKGDSGDDFSGTGNINDMGYYDSNSGLNKHKVGEKLANENGLYDLHGNLWEWCWDYYSASYYTENNQVNPTGPTNGSRRVVRGGSFQDGFNLARSSNRTIKKLDLSATGLRLVRNAD